MKNYDTPQARRYIDAAHARGELNGTVGELLEVLRLLVQVIDVHYPADQFSMLAHARRLLLEAESISTGEE